MTSAHAAMRSWYTEQLRSFWAARFQSYLDGSDPDNKRYPREKELGDAAVKVDRKKKWTALPRPVREAAEYYYNRVEAEDWGSVRVYRVPTDHGETYAVRVTTDGDDGWIEVYDLQGHLLGAGRTYIELIAWAPREEVRQQFFDNWPEALDRSKTLWQPPAPPAPEPRFKPGQAVECRWQYSFIWFPATVTQAELDRVQVEFEDHSRKWLPLDSVREATGYGSEGLPEPMPEMAAIKPGDRVDCRWQGDEIWFPATVLERHGNRVHVRREGDGEEEWTAPGYCRPPTPDEPEPEPPFAVGDYVDFRWLGSTEIYKGWIVERRGNRLRIEAEDGTEEWTTVGKCRRLTDPDEDGGAFPEVAVGDRVDCRYQGGRKHFPGKITDRRGNRILVDYDEGSREWTSPRLCRRRKKPRGKSGSRQKSE